MPQLFEFCSGCGEHTGILDTVGDIDLIHVFHQIQGSLFSDMLVKSSAEVVGNVVFTVRERARSAKSAHDGAVLASDAAFYFFSVNRTVPFFKGMTGLEYRNLELGFEFYQLICGVDAARTCSYDYHVIIHLITEVLSYILRADKTQFFACAYSVIILYPAD